MFRREGVSVSDYDLEDLPLKDSHRTADRRLNPDVVVVSKKSHSLMFFSATVLRRVQDI